MGKRVMVVDDSMFVQFQIQNILSGSGYEIAACCWSGEEALNRYEQIAPDVVTMDMVMPGMSGLEAAKAILGSHNDARIVMVSSQSEEDGGAASREAKTIGAVDFLDKPVQGVQLLAALDHATGKILG